MGGIYSVAYLLDTIQNCNLSFSIRLLVLSGVRDLWPSSYWVNFLPVFQVYDQWSISRQRTPMRDKREGVIVTWKNGRDLLSQDQPPYLPSRYSIYNCNFSLSIQIWRIWMTRETSLAIAYQRREVKTAHCTVVF